MTAERYAKLSAPFRSRPWAVKGLQGANRALTMLCYICYPALLLWLLLHWDARLWNAILVPAVSFVVVSLFRKKLNRKRPYETLDIQPLIVKNTRGQSFPSRHVFSVFVIAMTWGWICPPAGAALMVVGVLVALIRIVGGVHYPSDVLAGAVIGILAGLVLYL